MIEIAWGEEDAGRLKRNMVLLVVVVGRLA
jgi:hypothetical protein